MSSPRLSLRNKVALAGAAVAGLVAPLAPAAAPADAETIPVPTIACSRETCYGQLCQINTSTGNVACRLVASWPAPAVPSRPTPAPPTITT